MKLLILLSLPFLALVHGQTETVVDPALGVTVVEVVTTGILGQATTVTLSTLTDDTTTTSTTPLTTSTTTPLTSTTTPLTTSTTAAVEATTTPPQVVGVPASNTGSVGDPTPYTYTTTDAAGDFITVQDIFTPSFAATVLSTPTSSGTILDYDQWLSLIGTNTAVAGTSGGTKAWTPSGRGLVMGVSVALGALGGAALVMA
ncbi:uncharacterized protein STEHIDRAFT_165548 [Stereum hirsutum FP-91666 SS1]|uniref:uncharacterized protein n=1 Tax=Stereum hirsutum (strain FP-91666) TaxID=721885 RepID=UPI000440A214|nr:uncharacterized protein STEHIDRAFT_165548 [Stereum hirsutum FP-91666 SS1]EIM91177.1 hypothetical protein STEHIDRAFT_165548 [Stereum hirsutum FP-91666 SS1]